MWILWFKIDGKVVVFITSQKQKAICYLKKCIHENQGSVLDPFLFIIYKNDFGKCIEHSKTYDLDDD